MAKIQLKSDNITPFGGLYSIFNQFNRSDVRETVDSFLGRRSLDPKAFSYGDVFASLFAKYLCGGDCIEDVMDIKSFWDGHDNIKIASSDTIERALRGLSCDNTTYMNDNNVAYDFNTADKLNSLMLRLLKTTKQLNPGDCIDLDFDHQFIACDKKDSKYSYKKAEGYFPGVATVGGLIVGIENRDANTNVKFQQADTLKRIIERLEIESRVVIRNFRADCGSYSEAIIGYVKDHCEHFYIRANNCQSRRTKLSEEDPAAESEGLFGTEYVYRCIVTNDWSNSEKDIIAYYNKRGALERNFDCQNNDFGWAHLPFSYLKENTVFLLVTAMLKNFYLYILQAIGSAVKGLDIKNRLKRFIRLFISAPAKWIRSGRQEVLNIYSRRQVYLIL